MQKSFSNQSAKMSRMSGGAIQGFTLTELLVVLCVTGMLAAVLLSVAFTTRERVMRAQCADNLRQIGVGLNVYANEEKGYLPVCDWPPGANPWETYQACRMDFPGSTNVIQGYYNLGLLFRTKVVPDPKIFYCPSLAHVSEEFSYNFYATLGWPSSSTFGNPGGNPYIRVGYSYYPQLRATERVISLGIYTLPALTFSAVQLEFGGRFTAVTPAKWTGLNPKKSIVTDLVVASNLLSHRASGSVAGLNALFPDGRVTFQNARTDPRTGPNSPWYSVFWNNPDPGHNPTYFRVIMNDWEP